MVPFLFDFVFIAHQHGFALGVVQGTLTPGLITVTAPVEVGGLPGT